MVDVDVHIGGHAYTLSCAPGEEADLHRLAAVVDGEVARARTLGGMTEARQLLFAAIFLAERLTSASMPDHATETEVLTRIADRLEHLAARLLQLADGGA